MWFCLWIKLRWLDLILSAKEYCTTSFNSCPFFFPITIQLEKFGVFSLPFSQVSKGLQLKNIFEVAFQILDWAQETNFCISLGGRCWFMSWPCEMGTESREMNIKLFHSVPLIFEHFNAFHTKKPTQPTPSSPYYQVSKETERMLV